jgi:hypothetical protein
MTKPKLPQSEDVVRREAVLAEKKRITNAYMAGAVDEGEWRSRIAEIDRRLKQLPAKASTQRIARQRLTSWAQLWDGAPIEVRRQACAQLFQSVTVDMQSHTLRLQPWDEFRPMFELRRAFVDGLRARGSVPRCGPPKGIAGDVRGDPAQVRPGDVTSRG